MSVCDRLARRHIFISAVVACAALLVQPHSARAQGGWSGTVATISPTSEYAFAPQVAVDPQGNAIAVWFIQDIEKPIIRAARYTTATGTWGNPVDVSTVVSGQAAFHPQIGVDSNGDATVVWYRSTSEASPGVIQAAHFTAATGTWSSATELSSKGSFPKLAVDVAGNAITVWYEFTHVIGSTTYTIHAARYDRATGSWGSVVTLATGTSTLTSSDYLDYPELAVDAGGNVIVVWSRHIGVTSSFRNIIQAARYTMATATWGGATDISGLNCLGCASPRVATTPNGNAMAVWSDRGPPSVLQAARYTATTGTWAAPVNISPISLDEYTYVLPRIAGDPAGNFTAVWSDAYYLATAARYSAATMTWGPATPISAFGNYALYPRVTVDTSGNATAVWYVDNPTGQTVQAARWSAATAAWSGVTNLSAVNVNVGVPEAAVDPAGNVTAVWYRILDPGTSSVIQSRRWLSTSGPAPGAPMLTGSISGTTVNLTWTPSPAGSAPTSYRLEAGTAPGSSNIFSGSVGLTTSLLSAVSPGTYYVRVRAANAGGISAPSNEVTLTVGAGAPGQPTVTSAIASGGILTVSWIAGAGASATSHRLDFYAGAALVATVNAGAGTSIAIPIPPGIQGTFGVRVTARNVSVAGAASELFTFTIGPACTVPASPSVSGGVVGGTASVSWPAVPGALSYVLSAGTSQGGTQYLAPTNIGANTAASASGLAAGFTAWVRVIAVNACGQESMPRDVFVQ